jgi:hypothetical protein
MSFDLNLNFQFSILNFELRVRPVSVSVSVSVPENTLAAWTEAARPGAGTFFGLSSSLPRVGKFEIRNSSSPIPNSEF